MKIEGKGKALAVFIGETDHWHGKPTYVAIVERAKSQGLAGATASRGLMGFGANSRVHSAHLLDFSQDLPMVITIVDSEEKINAFLPILDEMVEEGLVMTWDATVEVYRHSK